MCPHCFQPLPDAILRHCMLGPIRAAAAGLQLFPDAECRLRPVRTGRYANCRRSLDTSLDTAVGLGPLLLASLSRVMPSALSNKGYNGRQISARGISWHCREDVTSNSAWMSQDPRQHLSDASADPIEILRLIVTADNSQVVRNARECDATDTSKRPETDRQLV